MKKIITILFICFLIAPQSCSRSGPNPGPTETPDIALFGYLEGTVTIGPLCPLEPCDISDTDKDNVYKERSLLVYNEGKRNLLETVQLDRTGVFRVPLRTGKYVLELKTSNKIDRSDPPMPYNFDVMANQITSLDFKIDTGIR